MTSVRQIVTSKENPLLQNEKTESEEEKQVKELDNERDDLAKRKSPSVLPQLQDVLFVNASITKADLETWKRLKLSGEPRYGLLVDRIGTLGSMLSLPQSSVCACGFILEECLQSLPISIFRKSPKISTDMLSVMK